MRNLMKLQIRPFLKSVKKLGERKRPTRREANEIFVGFVSFRFNSISFECLFSLRILYQPPDIVIYASSSLLFLFLIEMTQNPEEERDEFTISLWRVPYFFPHVCH